jgi:hypothetical protein
LDVYPKQVWFASGDNYTDVDLKAVYSFPVIPKILVEAWDIDQVGPRIKDEFYPGSKHYPIDLSDIKIDGKSIDISHLKIISILLLDEEQANIGNLTEKQVIEMDKIILKLKMDMNRYIYHARSRVGSETGNSARCTFWAKNSATRDRVPQGPYKLFLGRNLKFCCGRDALVQDESRHIADAIDIHIPENVTAITEYGYEVRGTKRLNVLWFKEDQNICVQQWDYDKVNVNTLEFANLNNHHERAQTILDVRLFKLMENAGNLNGPSVLRM